MSLSKRMYDDLNREFEPRYDDKVEEWPSEQELNEDSEREE